MGAIADRILYERTFSMADRWERGKEKLAMAIARRLPRRLRLWVIVQAHASLTTGDLGTRHPDTVTAFDLYVVCKAP